MSDEPRMKTCTKCGETRPWTLEYFPHNGGGHLRPSCHVCARQAARQWAKDHPEKSREQCKRYYHAHRDRALTYYKKNRDTILAKIRGMDAAKRDAINARRRALYAEQKAPRLGAEGAGR